MPDLKLLKDLVFESDNKACFIERERILSRLANEMSDYNSEYKYAIILSRHLSDIQNYADNAQIPFKDEVAREKFVLDSILLSATQRNADMLVTVRLYGFSEYFVSLPKWQQIAVLNITEYNY